MTPSQIAVRVRLLGQRAFQRSSNAVQRSIRSIANTARNANRQVGQLNAQVNLFGILQKAAAPLAMIAAVGLLAQVVVTLAGGFIALAGAMAPALGLMMIYPGAIGAAVQGMLAFKFATNGVMDAVGGLDDAMDPEKFAKLSPAMKLLAKDLDAVKPRLRELRADMGDAIAPGLRGGLHELVAGLTPLYPYLVRTSAAMGGLAQYAGLAFRALSADGTLGTVMSTNILMINRFGVAIIHLGAGFMYILRAARPMFNVLSDGARRASTAFLNWSKANQRNGNLGKFFDDAMLAGSRLWRIVRNLVIALWNIASAGKPLGDQILVDLVNLTREWVRWTRSVEGKGELAKFFAEIKPNLYAMATLVGHVAGAFTRLGRTPGLAKMITSIDSKLLPVLEQLFGAVAGNLTPAFIDFVSNMGGLVSMVTGTISPLATLFTVLSKIAYAFTWLVNKVPILKGVLGGLLTALLLLRAGVIAFNVVMAVLNFLMAANPITLVVLALAALAGALIYAYKHSETFRNIVNAVWTWIKDHWPLLLSILTGPIGAAVIYIIRHWDQVKEKVGAVWTWMKTAGSNIWNGMKDGLKAALNWIIGKLNWFIDKYNGTIGHLSDLPGVPDIKLPKIPLLAKGGTVLGVGSQWISGEAGPELGTVTNNGVKIKPLGAGGSTVTKANVGGGMLDEGALADLLTLWVDLTANIDGAPVARAVSKHAKKSAVRQGRAFAGA